MKSAFFIGISASICIAHCLLDNRVDRIEARLSEAESCIKDSLKGQSVVSLGPLCQEQPQPFHSIPTPYELVVLSNRVSVVDGTDVVWSEAEGGAE